MQTGHWTIQDGYVQDDTGTPCVGFSLGQGPREKQSICSGATVWRKIFQVQGTALPTVWPRRESTASVYPVCAIETATMTHRVREKAECVDASPPHKRQSTVM